MKLFDHVGEIAEDQECFVCVLIDEVESMVSARASSVKSSEPSDAVRVVNAVLTSLDALRRRSNVLLLCTSNMVTNIDAAFLDRVDMRIYLGPPPIGARGIIKEKGSGGTLGDIANHLSAQGNVTLDGQRDMLVEPPSRSGGSSCGESLEQTLYRVAELSEVSMLDYIHALLNTVLLDRDEGKQLEQQCHT
eukprot:gene507-540_t